MNTRLLLITCLFFLSSCGDFFGQKGIVFFGDSANPEEPEIVNGQTKLQSFVFNRNSTKINTCKTSIKAVKPLSRIRSAQYLSTLKVVFGKDSVNNSIEELPKNALRDGDEFLKAIINNVEKLANNLAEELINNNTLFNCRGLKLLNMNCMDQILSKFNETVLITPLKNNRKLDDIKNKLNNNEAKSALSTFLQALLLHPNFLYSLENDSSRLDEKEYKARLSQFLFGVSSHQFIGDDKQYLKSASNDRANISALLDDSAFSNQFIENYLFNWMNLSKLEQGIKSHSTISNSLFNSFKTETRLFLRYSIENNLSIHDLIGSDLTFLNEELATHYNVSGNFDNRFQQYSYPSSSKRTGGLLTQGLFLSINANEKTTDPVFRGHWIMDHLLCRKIGSPPATFDFPKFDGASTSKKEIIIAQRGQKNTSCYGCHSALDPAGFVLENFDSTGKQRNEISGFSIDLSSELNGKQFSDLDEFLTIMKNTPEYPKCFIRKMFEFSLKRPLKKSEECLIDNVYNKTEEAGFRIKDIVSEIATQSHIRKK